MPIWAPAGPGHAGEPSLPCLGKTRSPFPAMLSGLVWGLSTQGGDKVQRVRRVGKPQMEGLTVPISSPHGCQRSVILWVKGSTFVPGNTRLHVAQACSALSLKCQAHMDDPPILPENRNIDECAHELQASLAPLPGPVPCAK